MNIWKKLSLGLTIASCVLGCGVNDHKGPYRRLLIIAVDNSGSTQDVRNHVLAATSELAGDLDGETRLVLLRFGRHVQEVFDGAPTDEDAFALLLAKTLKQSDPEKGTDYANLVKALAVYATDAKEREIECLVAGDGGNDFEDEWHRNLYRRSALALATNSRVDSIRFWGIEVGRREELKDVFKGHSSKLKLCGIDEPILDAS